MKKIILLTLVTLGFTSAAIAQNNIHPGVAGQPSDVRDKWNAMSSEDREKAKADTKAKWQNMSASEKEDLQNQAVDTWQKLSPKEKADLRAQAEALISNMSPQEKAALEREAANLSPEKKKLFDSKF